ncbi:MAG: penicillin-binding transpeptidase domain-containing protein [Anaerolineales bacterium]|nr:penicillin-binding transpeptidase domain-containing protein [Anaerolineales bacterium]
MATLTKLLHLMRGGLTLSFALLLLIACIRTPMGTAVQPTLTATPHTPDPHGTAQAFLDAWQRGDYAGMYSLLSPLSRDALGLADFQARYESVNRTAGVSQVTARVLNALNSGTKAGVLYEVTLRTALFGDLRRTITMPLVFTEGRWAVAWTDGLILPELEGGGRLSLEVSFPSRGNVYDRNGLGLAAQGEAVAIGVRPGAMTDEGAVLNALSPLLGLSPQALQQKYANARPDWYVPLGEAAATDVQARLSTLTALPGVELRTYNTRFYPFGGVAPQVIGYLGAITPEQLAEFQALGYTGDERIGQAGLEAWGEKVLAGRPAGVLQATFPDGRVIRLAESARRPAESIYTTLDRPLQLAAQQLLAGFPYPVRGAIVVLDPATGAVLAMASSPTFDPNLFDPTNPHSDQLPAILNDPANPLLNRATQGVYPPGSIFKIPVMAAALLSGQFTRDTIIECGHVWSGLGPNALKYNWTFGRGIKPYGKINLVQALATSCNPYFYTVAFTLGQTDAHFIPKVARQFGFGATTQIGQVAEAAGLVGDPDWKQSTLNDPWRPGDSVNLGIGQGYILVTPLQVAQMMAAIRNGGVIYRPQLVLRVEPPGGPPSYELEPVVTGRLPVDAEQLQVIREGLTAVTSDRLGTARSHFLGLSVPVAGKTGTAEDPAGGAPHAWFAGYTEANRPDKPDIAIAILIENIGEGSTFAAPLFRRLVEIYFDGKPSTYLLPWESAPGVGLTPMP